MGKRLFGDLLKQKKSHTSPSFARPNPMVFVRIDHTAPTDRKDEIDSFTSAD